MLSKIKISQKVYLLGAIQFLLIAIVGAVGYIQMEKIGHELYGIAEEDIPITKKLTVLTEHQLEEAILFERSMRISLNAKLTKYDDAEHLAEVRYKLNGLIKKSKSEFTDITAFIKKVNATVHSPEITAKFNKLLNGLINANDNYLKLIKESDEVLNLIDNSNDMTLLNERLVVVEKHRDEIDHELIEMLNDVQNFTLEAALTAEHDEIAGVRLLIMFVIISSIVALILPMIISKSITRPIIVLNEMLVEIASGDGDLTKTLPEKARDETGDTARAFNNFINKLRETIGSISNSVDLLDGSSKVASGEMSNTLDNIETQSNEINMVATAVNQMNSSFQEVASNTSEASSMASSVKSSVKSGQSSASQSHEIIEQLAKEIELASATIGTLAEKTNGIGMVLDTIRAIADQTNLLALNAAIEAARAGETGRGFAVVADEVRSLAQRTQSSTGDIQTLVESLQTEAKNAVDCMDKGSESTTLCLEKSNATGAAFVEVSNIVNSISALNEQIAAATEEQSAVANEVNISLSNITEIAETTNIGAKNTAKASDTINVGVGDLRDQVGQFQI